MASYDDDLLAAPQLRLYVGNGDADHDDESHEELLPVGGQSDENQVLLKRHNEDDPQHRAGEAALASGYQCTAENNRGDDPKQLRVDDVVRVAVVDERNVENSHDACENAHVHIDEVLYPPYVEAGASGRLHV